MDSHDVGRSRGGKLAAMRSIAQPVLVMGIDSDILYPLYQQEELATHIPNARLQVVRSEEHTSELQSLMRTSYAVFCLKKKKQYYYKLPTSTTDHLYDEI